MAPPETSGTYHTDTLTLGSASIDQDFGIPDRVAGLGPTYHDIIGFGPNAMTKSATSQERIVPTPMDNLITAGWFKSNIFGVYFERMDDGEDHIRNGEVALGDYDSSRYLGQILWAEPSTSYPTNTYWGFHLDKICYGNTELNGNEEDMNNGIADTGVSMTLLPSAQFQSLLDLIPGATVQDGLISVFATNLKRLKPLSFVFRGRRLALQPDQYTLLPQDNIRMGGDASNVYLWIGENTNTPTLGMILGQKFMEHFYSVYDGEKRRVRFAPVKK